MQDQAAKQDVRPESRPNLRQDARQDGVTGARDGAPQAATRIPGREAAAGPRAGGASLGSPADIGGRILGRVSHAVGSARSARTLERDAIVSVVQGRVRVVVPSQFVKEYVGRHFLPALRQAAADELAGGAASPPAEDVPVDIVVEAEAFPRAAGAGRATPREKAREATGAPGREASPNAAESETRAVRPARPVPAARRAPGLRELRHRLDDFVVGECNRIAYTAACAIADGTAPARFSPMFLHGACGEGKTHLLQGLAARAAARLGGRVRYTTAETFTNDFVQALKGGTTEGFRRAFRDVEVLCVDDIHFLAGKSATQAEFLHTLDTLGMSNRMLVLASDEPPREIRSLGEALISRFLSGAVIRIDPPDDAMRTELVRRLSVGRGLALDDAAVALIAERAGRPLPGGTLPSVREMEGMLTRVEAMRNFMGPGEGALPGGVLGRSMVAKALGLTSNDGRSPRRPVPSPLIIERVCRALRVDASDLMSRGRHARVVLGRALVTYLSRRLTTMSYPEIARSMARPNHSTVITAYNRVMAQMAAGKMVEGGPDLADVSIQSLAERLEREITSAAG